MDLYICIKQVPWQKPVLLLDLPSQSNTQSRSTPLSSIDIKMFYHLTMKGKAIPAIPPQGYSAMALVSTIAEACLPWARTTQNDRKEEIAFSFHGITKTFLTCFCSKSSSFDFCLVLSIQISKLRHINYRDLQKYGCDFKDSVISDCPSCWNTLCIKFRPYYSMLTRCSSRQAGSLLIWIPGKTYVFWRFWLQGTYPYSMQCKGGLMWWVISAPGDLDTERHWRKKPKKPWLRILAISFQVATE